jgi:hypothetical protein
MTGRATSAKTRAALLLTWLFVACGGRSVTNDDAGPLGGAAHGGTHAAGAPHVGGAQTPGGSISLGGATGGSAGAKGGTPTLGSAGALTGSAGEVPGSAGEMTGSAGAPPFVDAGGTGGAPEASGGAGGAGATCESQGNVYSVGANWTEGCRRCSCAAGGVVSCDARQCRLLCLRIARSFAILRAEAAQCEIGDADACAQFVGPGSLSCDCPVPYGVDRGAEAQVLRENYAQYACKPNPECDCPAWETASCVEGTCQGTAL